MRPAPPRWVAPMAVVLCVSTLVAGCAARRARTEARGDRAQLTAEQLTVGRYQTLYDAIAALRSHWLRPRTVDSFATPTQVVVYMDNMRLGGVEVLRRIAPTGIAYVRRIDGAVAGTRWGIGHGQGVIYVASEGINQIAAP